jgi:AcrR family transcriptional regulator
MKRVKPRRERLTGEERRVHIIEAALKVFAEKGFRGARTKQIAQLAGISETLIFQHFQGKEDLYRHALQELFGRHPVMPEVHEMVVRRDDFGVLSTVASHLIKHNRQDPRIMRLAMFSALEGLQFGEMSHDHENAGPSMRDLLAGYLQQRIEEGAFRDADAQIAAQLFLGTVYMYCADQAASLSGPPLASTEEEVVNTLVTVFLKGLAK